MKKVFLIALIVILAGVSIVVGAYVYKLTIPGDVVVVETPEGEYKLEAYEDENCTKPLTYVDWGSLQPGESKPFTFYIKNTGNLTIPSYTVDAVSDVDKWGPSAHYTKIPLGEVRKVYVSLRIDSDAGPGDYSVTIEVTCPVP